MQSITTQVGGRTYRYEPRMDGGFLGIDVVDERGDLIVDVGITTIGDGSVGVSVRDDRGEVYGELFYPPIDRKAFRDRYQVLMGELNELPPNLQAPIEDHPEIDVLIGHVYHDEITRDDVERLERLMRMIDRAQAFMAAVA